MRSALFVQQNFIMHSGEPSSYKIECDSLTDDDIETLAWIIVQKTKQYTTQDGWGIKEVYGVPRGGMRLAQALDEYWDTNGTIRLIVDDVLTTGTSMEVAKKELEWDDAAGIVIFARGKCPSWVTPIFDMHYFLTRNDIY